MQPHYPQILLYFIYVFGGSGVLPQDLTIAMHTLCCLSHTSSPSVTLNILMYVLLVPFFL
jgi:hypothetical protein